MLLTFESKHGTYIHLRFVDSLFHGFLMLLKLFSNLRHKIIHLEREAVSGHCTVSPRNCIASALNFIVMQVIKINCDSLEWKQRLKPRPNDGNISTQHFATLLAQHLQATAKRSQQMNSTYSQTSGCEQFSQATISPERPVFQNTKSFQVKSLYLEPLVSDHL